MISLDKMFGNPYASLAIGTLNLLLFSKDLLKRLIKANTAGQFDAIIAFLTPLIPILETEVSNIDTSVNLRVGQTDHVDEVTLSFAHGMSDLQGPIAYALGGKDTIGYKEFYPHLLTEYGQATRETMPILVLRVSKAATKYAAQLGAPITATLHSYLTSFTAARSAQTTTIVDVSSGRSDRSAARTNVELALVKAGSFIGFTYPGDVATCSSFFNFNLLYSVVSHKHVTLTGSLLEGAQVAVVNQTFTDSMGIIFRNTGTNAAITVWLNLTAVGAPSPTAYVIQPGKAVIVKPSDLGDLVNTFLLIQNLSDVNPASYEVVIVG